LIEIIEIVNKQIKAFTKKYKLSLVNANETSWSIQDIDQILLISIELSVHNSKSIIELTGYLACELNQANAIYFKGILDNDKIKEQLENTNIELLGSLMLNSKTLIFDNAFKEDFEYLVLLELCEFDYKNKKIINLLSDEYKRIISLNLN